MNGECPEGTIPIVRRQRFESDVIHKAKPTPQFNGSKVVGITAPPGYEVAHQLTLQTIKFIIFNRKIKLQLLIHVFLFVLFQYALVTLSGSKYYGTQATLNVWNPASFNNEHSIAQIWISDGDGKARSTIEAGWMVSFSQ